MKRLIYSMTAGIGGASFLFVATAEFGHASPSLEGMTLSSVFFGSLAGAILHMRDSLRARGQRRRGSCGVLPLDA